MPFKNSSLTSQLRMSKVNSGWKECLVANHPIPKSFSAVCFLVKIVSHLGFFALCHSPVIVVVEGYRLCRKGKGKAKSGVVTWKMLLL